MSQNLPSQVAYSLVPIASRAILVVSAVMLLAASIFAFFVNLGTHSIDQGSDEVVYARVIQTLSAAWRDGDEWFPLRHGKLPFFEKPPLRFVLGAGVYSVLGPGNIALRLPEAVMGLIAVALSVVLALRLSRSPPLSLCIGFLLLTVPEWMWFAHSFRRISLDGMLTVSLLCAFIAAWEFYQRLLKGEPRLLPLLLFSGFCGLGALTKSVAGLVPILSLCTLIAGATRKQRLSLVQVIKLAGCLSIGPLVFLSYCAILWTQSPHALSTFIGTEIVHRTTEGFDGHNVGDPFYYLTYLFVRGAFLPAAIMIVGTLLALAYGIASKWFHSKVSYQYRFIVLMGFFPVALYSIASAKVPWYLNPYAPLILIGVVMGLVDFVGHLSTLGKASAMQIIVALALLGFTTPTLLRRAARTVAVISGDTERIMFDKVVEDARNEHRPVFIVANIISGRSSPIKGRFNVEGVYREMLEDSLRSVESPLLIEAVEGAYAIVPTSRINEMPAGWLSCAELRPVFPRTQPATVLRYGLPGACS